MEDMLDSKVLFSLSFSKTNLRGGINLSLISYFVLFFCQIFERDLDVYI
jgi:hypothetical protein